MALIEGRMPLINRRFCLELRLFEMLGQYVRSFRVPVFHKFRIVSSSSSHYFASAQRLFFSEMIWDQEINKILGT